MKGKKYLGLLLAVLLFASEAQAREDVTVTVGGETVPAFVEAGVTYVRLADLLEEMGGWETQWDHTSRTAWAETNLFTLDVPAQRSYVLADGFSFDTGGRSLLREGRTYVPLRSMANLLGARVDFVDWDTPVRVLDIGTASCTEEDFYWLCRIISAESKGESLLGQIAVGNVILNRAASSQFPNTVKGVVFDRKNGVQFEPVSNGSIYDEPTEQSILAARLVLAGVDAAGESLYFFNPALSKGQWVRANRTYDSTIGCHMFFR
ncbi:MAG: cell wall hydrolase [Oscillospiraceae bacterium]|jgi:N-acetylmuramoyl-L-alanine amidase|nr:cell wall hydrolase [Oscillospiraceae bacterium]